MMTSPIISILTIVTTNRGICLRELLTLIINFALQAFDKENYRFFLYHYFGGNVDFCLYGHESGRSDDCRFTVLSFI